MLRQVLPWGIFMFVTTGLFPLLLNYSRGDEILIRDIIIPGVFWTFGGWSYGVGSWYFGEMLYKKHITNRS